MVDPLPDEAALQPRVGAHCLPVLHQIAVGVAHGVRVLAHDDGPVVAVGGHLDDAGHAGVHGPQNVDDRRVLGRVVVDGAGRVVGANPVGHGHVVGAVARLVAQRPVDDARVVLVPLHQPRRRGPRRPLARAGPWSAGPRRRGSRGWPRRRGGCRTRRTVRTSGAGPGSGRCARR